MGEMGKKKKSHHLGFLLHNIMQHCQSVYKNLKTLALIAGEKSVMDFYEKDKWANKENDKHEDADSLLHNTTSHTQCLYQISKS